MFALDQLATIYTEDAVTGAFTVVLKTGLACRMIILSTQPAQTGGDRASLAESRLMAWEAGYMTMPDDGSNVQVEVDGKRWNLATMTVAAVYIGSGAARRIDHWHAEVMRA